MAVEPVMRERSELGAEPLPLAERQAHSMKTLAELRDILDVVLLGGKLLIENGAETWRVEDTIRRLGIGLGADEMETYPTPTGIIASALAAGEHRTRVVRVPHLGVDLSRVGAVLDLARRADKGDLTCNTARAELERIAKMPRAYPMLLTVLCAAIAGACYGELQGGALPEFILGLVAAAVTIVMRNGLNTFFGRPVLLTVALSAFFGVTVALLGDQAAMCQEPELPVIAAVITLLPGVVMINSIADLINGNYTSGLSRAAQAMLTLGAVATGTMLSIAIFGGSVLL